MKTAVIALAFCTAHAGSPEHRLPDGARVDCLTADHAWEVDASSAWAESVGQALYYAVATDRQPAILLVPDGAACDHLRRLWAALAVVSVDVRVELVGYWC